MHELSIAQQLIAITKEHLPDETAPRVLRIKIRLGEFSCVHQDSLSKAFAMLAQGTAFEKTELVIERISLAVYCPKCDRIRNSPHGVQSLRCPQCNSPTGDIRQGQELELEWIEIASEDDAETRAMDGCRNSKLAQDSYQQNSHRQDTAHGTDGLFAS
ncbi:MAG: hydrogenase maturation nickel metallochaperone HypA [Pirellula sp.]